MTPGLIAIDQTQLLTEAMSLAAGNIGFKWLRELRIILCVVTYYQSQGRVSTETESLSIKTIQTRTSIALTYSAK